MFIVPAAPNGCQIVFTVDSCAMMALNSGCAMGCRADAILLEVTICACDEVNNESQLGVSWSVEA